MRRITGQDSSKLSRRSVLHAFYLLGLTRLLLGGRTFDTMGEGKRETVQASIRRGIVRRPDARPFSERDVSTSPTDPQYQNADTERVHTRLWIRGVWLMFGS